MQKLIGPIASTLVIAGLMFGACPVESAVVEFDSGTYYPSDPSETDPAKHASYDVIVDFVQAVAADPAEPPIVSTQAIGFSDETPSRPIWAVKISDNPGIEEDEPAVLFIGNIHGNEPLGVRVVLELLEVLTEYYDTDTGIQQMVDAFEIWIVPVLNPYGYEHSERKNGPACGGVDLNRNFDFFWSLRGTSGDCDNTYYGPWEGSEPETQAITDFVEEQRPIFGVTFHEGTPDIGMDGLIFRSWNRDIYLTSDSDCTASGVPHTCCTGAGTGTCTADDIPDPPDSDRMRQIAIVLADAIAGRRTTGIRPSHSRTGPASSITKHYALTGMFDYLIEMSETKWHYGNYPYFYDEAIEDLDSAELTELNNARELVYGYLGGITDMLRYFLFDDFPGYTYMGPGVTGRIYDCVTGDPVTARVSIMELDDLNGDLSVDDLDCDLDGDGNSDLGGDLFDFQSSEPLFGRYMRLTTDATSAQNWILDIDSGEHIPVLATVSVNDDDPSDVALTEFDVGLDSGADSDGDGLTDCEEVLQGTDPLDEDSDDDGLTDGEEAALGTNPLDDDSDDDGLTDGEEVALGTNPLDDDSDDDGLTDGEEVALGTNPLDDDSDDDGLSDGEEVSLGTDPLDADSDDDGLSDGEEVALGTDPLDADSDDDGLSDGEEVSLGTDPLDADSDDDGLSDGEEVSLGTDPLDADSDDDGLIDGDEVSLGTDPLDEDSDDDGLNDGEEVHVYGTDPLDPDTDDDGLSDKQEIDLLTDPLDPDSDGDGIADGSDPDFVAAIVESLPASAFQSDAEGLRTAILAALDNAERKISSGKTNVALTMLRNLRVHIDGCDSEGGLPDNDDWIVDCDAQVEVRDWLDLLVFNLE